MNQTYTTSERKHMERIKSLPCSVCDASAPSDAHHIRQSQPYLCIPLCKDCHQDSLLGIHGRKAAWNVRKMDEMDALAVTMLRLLGDGFNGRKR